MVIGTLQVDHICFEAIVGVLPHERITPQPLVLGFSIELDIEPAARSHALEATVNYAQLTQELCETVQTERFELLETLVLTLAEFALSKYPQLLSITVRCTKPQAIPNTSGPTAQVCLKRTP